MILSKKLADIVRATERDGTWCTRKDMIAGGVDPRVADDGYGGTVKARIPDTRRTGP